MILNPEETGRLSEVIREGAYYGMQTFDQALLAHVQAGRVTAEDALRAANRPQDLRLMLAQAAAPVPVPASPCSSRPHGPRSSCPPRAGTRPPMPRLSTPPPAASGTPPPRAASR